ncbi:hypothetical protein [Chitinophaga eiseniae]|uniref:Uncharacterized protein n=1 Tax=Chitinophaga eiseniae TaxID=634771 RepID=A0A847SMI2_9BACT|nr:hypothetical protein [Chitinophaga eiseniae]NLR80435.1 hypothetical protein [Chitinophaga eiseniae]
MESKAAKQIGGKSAFVAVLFAVIVLEIFWLMMGTGGDLANDLIFFIAAQANIFVVTFFILLFSTTYFLGRYAGRDILIRNKNHIWIGIKYALLTSVINWIYLLIIYQVNHILEHAWNAVIEALLTLTIAIFMAWMFAMKRIRLKAGRG